LLKIPFTPLLLKLGKAFFRAAKSFATVALADIKACSALS